MQRRKDGGQRTGSRRGTEHQAQGTVQDVRIPIHRASLGVQHHLGGASPSANNFNGFRLGQGRGQRSPQCHEKPHQHPPAQARTGDGSFHAGSLGALKMNLLDVHQLSTADWCAPCVPVPLHCGQGFVLWNIKFFLSWLPVVRYRRQQTETASAGQKRLFACDRCTAGLLSFHPPTPKYP